MSRIPDTPKRAFISSDSATLFIDGIDFVHQDGNLLTVHMKSSSIIKMTYTTVEMANDAVRFIREYA